MILTCPGCDGRYDVTGHATGQKFRCRCGMMMTLPELAASDLDDAASHRPCPRCDAPLHPRRVDDLVIDECARCLGVFLDQVAIQRVIVDRAQSRAEALLGALPRVEIHPVPAAGQKMYLRCPVCDTVMNRRLFATGTGIIIDVCRTHGTFFDAGELPLIIDFVMHGGLDTAQRRDLERRREAAKRELAQSHAAALPVARLHLPPTSASSALIDFLVSLFDGPSRE